MTCPNCQRQRRYHRGDVCRCGRAWSSEPVPHIVEVLRTGVTPTGEPFMVCIWTGINPDGALGRQLRTERRRKAASA
jgi:hypothetical protein